MFHKIMCEIAVSLKYSVPLDTIVVYSIQGNTIHRSRSISLHPRTVIRTRNRLKLAQRSIFLLRNFYLLIRATHNPRKCFFYLIQKKETSWTILVKSRSFDIYIYTYMEKEEKKIMNRFFIRRRPPHFVQLCRINDQSGSLRLLVTDSWWIFQRARWGIIISSRVSPRLLIAKRSSVGPVSYRELLAISSHPFFPTIFSFHLLLLSPSPFPCFFLRFLRYRLHLPPFTIIATFGLETFLIPLHCLFTNVFKT